MSLKSILESSTYKERRQARGILRKARCKIAKPENWIQGHEVETDSQGNYAFCAIGAIYDTKAAKFTLAIDVLNALCPKHMYSIVTYNDSDGRKHYEVIRKFDRAIEVLEGK